MAGQLSKNDIISEQEKPDGLKISPFKHRYLKNASYDVSPTIIALSTKTGMLETVYRDKKYPYKYYIYVKAKDTVLSVTREFISVPSNIAGSVVSRVSSVSEGFGHVSTSIDPNWKGALLIALGNPTNKPIKIYVGGSSDESESNNPLATISFYYLETPCRDVDNSYSGMRLDLLEKQEYSQRHGVKAWFTKLFHPRRRLFTDFFFRYCNEVIKPSKNWDDVVKELQGHTPKPVCEYCKSYVDATKKKEKLHLADFIERENAYLKLVHWLQKNWTTICKIIAVIFAILVVFGILPESMQLAIKKFFDSYRLF